MRLVLLPLASLLLGSEAFRDLSGNPISRPIMYPEYFQRVRGPQRFTVLKMSARSPPLGIRVIKTVTVGGHDGGGGGGLFTNIRPLRDSTKGDSFPALFQDNTRDNEYSGLEQNHHQSTLFSSGINRPSTSHSRPSQPSNVGHVPSGPVRNVLQPTRTLSRDPSQPSFSHHQQQPQPQNENSGFVQTFQNHNNHHHLNNNNNNNNNNGSPENDQNTSSFKQHKQDFQPTSFEDEERPVGEGDKTELDGVGFPHPERNPYCNVRPEPGTCRAAFPRYYFDPKRGVCDCFLYGGCREDGRRDNPGSFLTLEDCQKECRPPVKEEGPYCKEIFKDEEHFVSYLVESSPNPTKNAHTDHLSDAEVLSALF